MSVSKYLLINLFVIVLFYSSQARRIPKYIQICKRSDPELNKCVLNSIEKLRPHLLKGIPEFRIPPYDPLLIPQIELDESRGPVAFKAGFTDLRVFGAKDTVVKKINVDLDNLKIDMELFFPKLKLDATYDIKGRILLVPINGNGATQSNFTDVTASITVIGNPHMRKGQTYVTLKDRIVDIDIQGATINFANLFNGNKELGDATNRFFNEHWRDIMVEIRPIVEDTIAEIVYSIVKQVFDTFSLEQLLPH